MVDLLLGALPALLSDPANIVFMFICTGLVCMATLGVAFFYSGLTARRLALSMLVFPAVLAPIVVLEWYIIGYLLLYSANASLHFIGNGYFAVLRHTQDTYFNIDTLYVGHSGEIHALSHAVFALLFVMITATLTFPAVVERGRLVPMCVFAVVWCVAIQNPVVYWHWSANGWLHRLGVLDYSGGAPVHVLSGTVAFVYSWMLGPRRDYGGEYYPSSSGAMVVGTVLVAVGWIGFCAGCAFVPGIPALLAVVNVAVASSTACVAWGAIEFFLCYRVSVVGLCSGFFSGLVAITPGCGYVDFWAAAIIGLCGGVSCNLATRIKFWLKVDDALDVYAVHGVGGVVGSVFTGVFALRDIALIGDGVVDNIKGGWINRHFVQVPIQLASCAATIGYSAAVTACALLIIDHIPGLGLRVTPEEEEAGADALVFGEFVHDYVEFLPVLRRDDFERKVE